MRVHNIKSNSGSQRKSERKKRWNTTAQPSKQSNPIKQRNTKRENNRQFYVFMLNLLRDCNQSCTSACTVLTADCWSNKNTFHTCQCCVSAAGTRLLTVFVTRRSMSSVPVSFQWDDTFEFTSGQHCWLDQKTQRLLVQLSNMIFDLLFDFLSLFAKSKVNIPSQVLMYFSLVFLCFTTADHALIAHTQHTHTADQ